MEEEFKRVLKEGNISKILRYKISNKVNLIVDNICTMKIEPISQILPLLNIKINDGNTKPLFIKATECSPEIFGFIKLYYNNTNSGIFNAYIHALKNDRIDILKKIRGISASNLKKIRDYSHSLKNISLETKSFVDADHRKARAKKSVSEPSLYIKRMMKYNVRKSLNKI